LSMYKNNSKNTLGIHSCFEKPVLQTSNAFMFISYHRYVYQPFLSVERFFK